MQINNKFNIGDLVYLKTDTDQILRMVTEITIQPGLLIYQLTAGLTVTQHYELEITSDKNILLTL